VADRIKFYMDEHIPSAVAEALRRRGIDVLRAQEAGMHPARDEEHLAIAAREGRVIFTQDADFLRLHRAGVTHSGIAYIPQHAPIGDMVFGLTLVYELITPEDMINHVEFL
jgi:uncharacterized protein with PIN domain